MTIDRSTRDRYFTLLEAHVCRPAEEHLAEAAQLGQELVRAGVPEEEIAEIHEEALLRLAETQTELALRDAATSISAPLMEILMSYSLAFREEIDHRKRVETSLRASENRFRTILDENADGIIAVDRDSIIRYVNPAAESLLHSPGEGLLGSKFAFPVVAGEVCEVDIPHEDGERLVAKLHAVKTEMDGKPLYVVTLSDITEMARLREELRALALRDELTGLYNRRGFRILAQQQLKLARRAKTHMLLLFADYDRLKEINDSHGHDAGDQALTEAARLMTGTFRESDVVARLGGDEFAVLAIDAPEGSAKMLVKRLKEAVLSLNSGNGRRCALSLSLGVAHWDPTQPCSLDEILTQADRAMYAEKRRKKAEAPRSNG